MPAALLTLLRKQLGMEKDQQFINMLVIMSDQTCINISPWIRPGSRSLPVCTLYCVGINLLKDSLIHGNLLDSEELCPNEHYSMPQDIAIRSLSPGLLDTNADDVVLHHCRDSSRRRRKLLLAGAGELSLPPIQAQTVLSLA